MRIAYWLLCAPMLFACGGSPDHGEDAEESALASTPIRQVAELVYDCDQSTGEGKTY